MTHHHDGETHLSSDTQDAADAAAFWDGVYREKAKRWSGNPNPQLIEEATGLAPGTALDLGCGEGADAIWLAQHGWTVTAVDVSAVALGRAAAHAIDAGLQDRIAWLQRDFASWHPEEGFDLVSAQFLHSPLLPWRDSLSSAAAAVAPGGTLLVVGHHPEGLSPWSGHNETDLLFTSQDLVEALTNGPGSWRINVADSRERMATGPDGQQATVIDSVLRATRKA
jgi:SAM-dependent methyltransferase